MWYFFLLHIVNSRNKMRSINIHPSKVQTVIRVICNNLGEFDGQIYYKKIHLACYITLNIPLNQFHTVNGIRMPRFRRPITYKSAYVPHHPDGIHFTLFLASFMYWTIKISPLKQMYIFNPIIKNHFSKHYNGFWLLRAQMPINFRLTSNLLYLKEFWNGPL